MNLVLHPQRRRYAAFTLIEVAIGMALTGIGIAALYAAISSSFSMMNATRQNLQATQLIIDRLETVRLAGWNNLTNTALLPPTTTTNWDALGITYSIRMDVTQPTFSYADDMRLVKMTVQWTNANVAQSREVQTYVSKYGIQSFLSR